MDRAVYCAVKEKVAIPLSAWPHFEAISRLFRVSFATVFSIYSLEVQNHVLRENHVVKAHIARYAQRYLAGMDACQLAFQLDFPPCVLLRRLLEELQLGLAKERITRVLRQPDLLPSLVSPEALQRLAAAAASGQGGSSGLRSGAGAAASPAAAAGEARGGNGPARGGDSAAALALLARLQRDVQECVLCDRVYSPTSDAMRHSAGVEWEERLNAELAAAGVAFWTEEQLRSRGYHKTPDARLQVPIAVQGRLVNWIDSKATFGEEKLHRQQTTEQYERYVNRFGPGLVIYWHGFIADLNQDENVLLMDRFPTAQEIVQLPCLPLPPPPPPLAADPAGGAGAGMMGSNGVGCEAGAKRAVCAQRSDAQGDAEADAII